MEKNFKTGVCTDCGFNTGTEIHINENCLCWNCAGGDRRNPEVQSQKPMLHRAEELINGARQKDYGDKLRNFDQIADFWNAQLKYKLAPGQKVTAEDVALCMIGVKAARLAKSPTHADSVIDIAGYIGCYDKILEERTSQITQVLDNHI